MERAGGAESATGRVIDDAPQKKCIGETVDLAVRFSDRRDQFAFAIRQFIVEILFGHHSGFDVPDPSFKTIKSLVDLFEAFIDLIKPFIDLVESFVNRQRKFLDRVRKVG